MLWWIINIIQNDRSWWKGKLFIIWKELKDYGRKNSQKNHCVFKVLWPSKSNESDVQRFWITSCDRLPCCIASFLYDGKQNISVYLNYGYLYGGDRCLRNGFDVINPVACQSNNLFQIHKVEMIDRISRICFPCAFIIFNMFYWTLYTYY